MSETIKVVQRKSRHKCFWHFCRAAGVVVLLQGLAMVPGGASASCGENIAGAYSCVVSPNYWGWQGPWYGDSGQLTDRFVADGWLSGGSYFYERQSTLGWASVQPVMVFDLGSIRPVGGIGLHTALSLWGPWWPEEIAVMVSDDGVNYYLAGPELRLAPGDFEPVLTQQQVDDALNRVPGAGGTLHWYRSCPYEARGRYVGLLMSPSAAGVIDLDEIEIYLGPASGMTAPRGPQVFSEGEAGRHSYTLYKAINERLTRDITTLRAKVQNASVSAGHREQLLTRLSELDGERSTLPVPTVAGFEAIVPFNEVHKGIFQVQSSLWQVQGGEAAEEGNGSRSPSLLWAMLRSGHAGGTVKIWKGHRWDPLGPFAEPQKGPAEFRIVMARNSVRSDVLNISNLSDQNQTAVLTLTGLPSGLKVFRVPLVDTQVFEPVASALIPIVKTSGTYSVEILPGMTSQVWIRCSSKNLAAGSYHGQIEVAVGEEMTEVAASIEVLSIALPDSLSLNIGGWDYPVHRNFQITNSNVNPFVAMMKEYGVNVTWESGAMGAGTFDANGNIVVPPPRGEVNYWVSLWPNAPRYGCVAGVTISHTDAEIKSWAIDWANYWQSKGIAPERVMLLFIDEATTEGNLNDILRVGRAIKEVSSFKIWTNIHYADPTAAPGVIGDVMREVCDIQAFNVSFMLTNPAAHDTFMQTHGRSGLEWWFYTGAQASRVSDPFTAWLLGGWFCFHKGLSGAHWWAFCDGGGGFSWNEYFNYGPSMTPLYLAYDSVTTSKSMEALREGAEDYEILTMLRNAYNQQEAGPVRDAMEHILVNRVPEVLSSHSSLSGWSWDSAKYRKAADDVRVGSLRLLESAGTSP